MINQFTTASGRNGFVYSQLTDPADLKAIARNIRSGDEVHVQIETTTYSEGRRLAILHVDYDTSDRVWFVKTWLGQAVEVNATSGHSEICDDRGQHIAAPDCIRRHLAGQIKESATDVLDGKVFPF
jgi:hypothetical protein